MAKKIGEILSGITHRRKDIDSVTKNVPDSTKVHTSDQLKKKGYDCSLGIHPRESVFEYAFIQNQKLQNQINMGNKVCGCRACNAIYVISRKVA